MGGAAGAGVLSGSSVISVSVVRIIVAIDAAFSSTDRVTLSGSMIPASIMFTYSPPMAHVIPDLDANWRRYQTLVRWRHARLRRNR